MAGWPCGQPSHLSDDCRGLPRRVKRSRSKPDYSPPYSKVKNAWSNTSTPPYGLINLEWGEIALYRFQKCNFKRHFRSNIQFHIECDTSLKPLQRATTDPPTVTERAVDAWRIQGACSCWHRVAYVSSVELLTQCSVRWCILYQLAQNVASLLCACFMHICLEYEGVRF